MSNNLKFVADVTLPDDTLVQPGQALTKTWRVQNNGSTPWQGCQLTLVSGEGMGGSNVALPATPVGGTAEVSVSLTAPANSGSHRGTWQAQDASGQHFGDKFWVQVKVAAAQQPQTVQAATTQPSAFLNTMIDIYQDNRLSDINALKNAGVLAIIHKATESLNFQDSQYHARQSLAQANGVLWGAYHFGRPGNGTDQANYFLDFARPDNSTLVALDIEGNAQNGMPLDEAERFVNQVHSRLGRWPVVYTSQSFINLINPSGRATVLTTCPLWVASYRDGHPRMPTGWTNWTFWQYTDGELGPEPHSAAGVSSCDRNYFNGTLDQLKAMWAK